MEPNNPTTERIITAIEAQKVTPRPKWYFVLRNSTLWLPGVITTLLGAYTVAGLIYGILHTHIDQGRLREYGNPIFLIASIPILWVISFLLFSLISTSLLRKTHTGYRHTTVQLLLLSVVSSIVIGILFYAFTQDSDDNKVRTFYRYPTEHQEEYFIKIFPPAPERNSSDLRIN